jgi:superfamily II DNA or RNA helicase
VGQTPPLQPGDVVRIRDERWRVVQQTGYGRAAILEVAPWEGRGPLARAQFLLPAERVERLPAVDTPRIVRPARWRTIARAVLAEATPGYDALRTAARADLQILPYQLEPALAVVRGLACRVLIADEVGLGKTIQASLLAAELLERTPDGRILIVCPAALRHQWRQEIAGRFGLDAAIADTLGLAQGAAGSAAATNPWAVSPVTIASIDYVKRPEVLRALEPLVWDALILDEAHAASGSSERAAAAQAIARRARTVVLLSATPHTGNDEAFARLCATGVLGQSAPLLLFRRTRADAGLESSRRTMWLRVSPTVAEREVHRRLMSYARLVWRTDGPGGRAARLAMAVLVKRAASSARALARSVERRLDLLGGATGPAHDQYLLPFDPEAAADALPLGLLAAPGLADARRERECLERLGDAARAAALAESKLHAVARLVRRARQPAIVFTEYRDTLDHVAAALPGVETVHLHGGLTSAERAASLARFVDGGAMVLLATDAASEGLNLQRRCRLVINLELPWTPLRLEQRAGRVDRIGQRARVHAVHLIARGTEEERTLATLHLKAVRARVALGAPVFDEGTVARAMLGGGGRVAAAPPRREGRQAGRNAAHRFAGTDVSAAARAEADRILRARALRPAGATPVEHRPVLTRLRRHAALRRCYWVHRIAYVGPDGQMLWSALIGLSAASPGTRARTPREVRALLAADPRGRSAALTGESRALLVTLAGAARRFGAPAAERLVAISQSLEESRARLASLQGGLFDRRADRMLAARRSVLDEALERCASRLAQIHALRTPVEGPSALVFAVAIE